MAITELDYRDEKECEECDGRGFNALWTGHGGNERVGTETEICEACGGNGFEVIEEAL